MVFPVGRRWWVIKLRSQAMVGRSIKVWPLLMSVRPFVVFKTLVVWRRRVKLWLIMLGLVKARGSLVTVWTIKVRSLMVTMTAKIWGILWWWRRMVPVMIWRRHVELGRWGWHIMVRSRVESVLRLPFAIWSSWWLSVRSAMMTKMRRRRISANGERAMRWRVREGMVGFAVLWRTASMVLAFTELREFELGVLEVWLPSWMIKFLLVRFASNLSVDLVSSVSCVVRDSSDDTLQTVAVTETDSVLTTMVSKSSLLLVNEILDLSELAPQVLQLCDVLLEVGVWGIEILDWL